MPQDRPSSCHRKQLHKPKQHTVASACLKSRHRPYGGDLGAAISPALLGLLLDQGPPRLVFVVAALALFLAIGSAAVVDRSGAAPARA
jgi:hypothetical protein